MTTKSRLKINKSKFNKLFINMKKQFNNYNKQIKAKNQKLIS